MASLIKGYEYDIFISYRQKDNKYDGWVTEFVNNLKKELEATFKEQISVYFDINPNDGLLETHDVEGSLKDKLKCLVFIPIISRTYCDPNSFAWEHELKTFIDTSSKDQYGLMIKLPNGNVSCRVLPIRIHDLSIADIKQCESVLGSALRGVEFVYKSAGVNRPLRANEDHPQDNINKTFYRDQINKVANSINEIITGLTKKPEEEFIPQNSLPEEKSERKILNKHSLGYSFSKRRVFYTVVIVTIFLFIGAWLLYPKIFKNGSELPLVIIMDSSHPTRVYDKEILAAGGTNADVISDILLDLPIRRQRETIGPSWHRDEEILKFQPYLIIIHFSGFNQGYQNTPRVRLKSFINFFAESDTRFLIYSRREEIILRHEVDSLLADTYVLHSKLKSRIDVFGVIDYGSWSWLNPITANALKLRVKEILIKDNKLHD